MVLLAVGRWQVTWFPKSKVRELWVVTHSHFNHVESFSGRWEGAVCSAKVSGALFKDISEHVTASPSCNGNVDITASVV